MKLHQDSAGALNTVTGYDTGWIEINRERHQGAILLAPEQPVQAWTPQTFEALATEHFQAVLDMRPEIVLLGTGAAQRFAHPRLLGVLAAAGVGVESMATPAACRTYNILIGEGRRVVAALLPT